MKSNITGLKPNYQQHKDKQFKAQLTKVYKAFAEKPMTMKEADVYTGVMRENICRYIDILFEQGKIQSIGIGGKRYFRKSEIEASLIQKK